MAKRTYSRDFASKYGSGGRKKDAAIRREVVDPLRELHEAGLLGLYCDWVLASHTPKSTTSTTTEDQHQSFSEHDRCQKPISTTPTTAGVMRIVLSGPTLTPGVRRYRHHPAWKSIPT
jgi:hypothetical protein